MDAAVMGKGAEAWNGRQALHFAAERDDVEESVEVARLLISKGAPVNATTAEGETPLHLSRKGAMTRLLLASGAKVDVMTTGIVKQLPLHHFAMTGDVDSLKLMLAYGADVNAVVPHDEEATALDTAVFWGKIDAVKFLLEHGAKPTEQTMKNARRFDTNPIELLSLLHKYGWKVGEELPRKSRKHFFR